jgi:hypothetical protein
MFALNQVLMENLIAKTTIPPEKFHSAILSMLVDLWVRQEFIYDHILLMRTGEPAMPLGEVVSEEYDSEYQQRILNKIRELQNTFGV